MLRPASVVSQPRGPGFDALFEKRLAILNVIYKVWVPHCLQAAAASEPKYVNRYPVAAPAGALRCLSPHSPDTWSVVWD